MASELSTNSTDTQKIIELLEKNNHYLQQLFELQRKEHRQAIAATVFHIILTMIPWIVILVLGYFVWQTIMHYLDALNSNINTLKGNFDTLSTFLQKITPDFNSIVPKLKNTWESIQFWNR